MDTKVCSKCKSVKLFSEFSKDKSKKDGHQTKCKACAKEYDDKYYAANSEELKEYNAEWRAANSEKKKKYSAEYRAANPDKVKEYNAEYQKANLHKFRTYGSNRRAAKSKAIPSWLTKEDWQAMEDINKEAKRIELETGTKMHVDHIHPLQGRLICGLQCPSNLQILTAAENCSKGNKFKPYVESEI